MYGPVIIATVILLFALPLWPWSKGWGWAPAGMVGMIAAIVWMVTLVVVFGAET